MVRQENESDVQDYFKGWAIPGPKYLVQKNPELQDHESLDGLCGHKKIFQLKNGHRYSTDDLIVAAMAFQSVPRLQRGLDLGSGLGTIAQILSWKFPGSKWVSIEAQQKSYELALKTAALNQSLDQIELKNGDLRDDLLLPSDQKFDLITGSPPYFPLGTGPLAGHPQKQACRFELRGDISDYIDRAKKHLDLGGVFVGIFPKVQCSRVYTALKKHNMTLLNDRDVVFKEGEDPLLWVFSATLDEYLPKRLLDQVPKDKSKSLCTLPAWIIRDKLGQVTPQYLTLKMSLGFPP